jgi:hypothetical protein
VGVAAAPMRLLRVVVRRVRSKHPAEVSLPEDQHPVGEFGADGQHEAFREAVRPRAAHPLFRRDGGMLAQIVGVPAVMGQLTQDLQVHPPQCAGPGPVAGHDDVQRQVSDRRPVGFQNSVMGLDQLFQAADSYWLMRPPRIGRRRILL